MSDQSGNNPEAPQTPPAWEPVATPAAYPPPQAQGYPPPPPPPPGYAQPPYQQAGYPPPSAAGLSSTAAAAISYLTFIPAVVFLVIDPYKRDPFVRFHAWQCIALTLTSIAISIVFIPLSFLHLLGLGLMMHMVVRLLLFAAWVIAIIKASRGERWKIPVVGDIAEKLAAA